MTTFSFDTVWFEWTEDADTGTHVPTNAGSGYLDLVTPENVLLGYSAISQDPTDGVTFDLIQGEQFYNLSFHGSSLSSLDEVLETQAYFVELTFDNGNLSTLMQFDFVTGHDAVTGAASGIRMSIVIAGDPLPYITDISELADLDASVVSAAFPSGALAPGQTFGWADLAPAWSQENDYIPGTEGNDLIRGGLGDDYIHGDLGDDRLFGGPGLDTLSYSGQSSGVTVDFNLGFAVHQTGEVDQIAGFEAVVGTFADDTLLGSSGSETFYGSLGTDTVDGRGGNDTFVLGYDMTFASLKNRTSQGVMGNETTLLHIENLVGNYFDDILIGDRFANTLRGNDGNDAIKGLGGNDFLDGGHGSDRLVGGAGADTFVFDYATPYGPEKDIIMDFRAGQDDHIAIASSEIVGFRDMKNNHATELNGNLIIQVNEDIKLVLKGVALSDLHASDFTFADPFAF